MIKEPPVVVIRTDSMARTARSSRASIASLAGSLRGSSSSSASMTQPAAAAPAVPAAPPPLTQCAAWPLLVTVDGLQQVKRDRLRREVWCDGFCEQTRRHSR